MVRPLLRGLYLIRAQILPQHVTLNDTMSTIISGSRPDDAARMGSVLAPAGARVSHGPDLACGDRGDGLMTGVAERGSAATQKLAQLTRE